MDSSSKDEKCRISKNPPDLGTPPATVFCSRTPAAFTMKREQKHGEVACGAGTLECHSSSQGGEKKTAQSSDSSALHVTSVSIEESGHRRCLSIKKHSTQKKQCRWEGRELKGPVKIFQRGMKGSISSYLED